MFKQLYNVFNCWHSLKLCLFVVNKLYDVVSTFKNVCVSDCCACSCVNICFVFQRPGSEEEVTGQVAVGYTRLSSQLGHKGQPW